MSVSSKRLKVQINENEMKALLWEVCRLGDTHSKITLAKPLNHITVPHMFLLKPECHHVLATSFEGRITSSSVDKARFVLFMHAHNGN